MNENDLRWFHRKEKDGWLQVGLCELHADLVDSFGFTLGPAPSTPVPRLTACRACAEPDFIRDLERCACRTTSRMQCPVRHRMGAL